MVNNITNFVVGFVFPMLLASFGLSGAFIIFIVCSIIGGIFAYKFIPETSGKSLEQIEVEFRNYEKNNVSGESIEA